MHSRLARIGKKSGDGGRWNQRRAESDRCRRLYRNGRARLDAALEQADIVLMHDKIENVEEAFVLSRRARSVIRQNVIISLGVVLLLIISALAEKINLTAGVIGHEGSTFWSF